MNKFADALLVLLFSLQLDQNSNKVFVDWQKIAPIANGRTHISSWIEKTSRFLLSYTHILCVCSTLFFFLFETERKGLFFQNSNQQLFKQTTKKKPNTIHCVVKANGKKNLFEKYQIATWLWFPQSEVL